MENSETNQFHLSEADIDVISRKMRDLFKADVEAIVNSVVQSLIPQIISGINESLTTKITSLECENKVLKDQISEMQVQADRAEQYSRRNCLRVSGIPETEKEDTDGIILKMVNDLGANLSIDEIDRTHRLGPRKQVGSKPRDIIIKFVSYRARQKLYNVRTSAKTTDPYKKVYVNEALTRYRSEMFYDARKLASDKLVEGAWTHDGQVLVRDLKRVIHRIDKPEQITELRAKSRSYASVAASK
jgi:hypothetical protein